jgi:hypothetical protein
MMRSEKRILTTHTGSLPRPEDLLEMMRARAAGPMTAPPCRHASEGRLANLCTGKSRPASTWSMTAR